MCLSSENKLIRQISLMAQVLFAKEQGTAYGYYWKGIWRQKAQKNIN